MLAFEAERARRHAERTFGRDVDGVRPERLDRGSQAGSRPPGEPDLGICGAGEGAEALGADDIDFVAHALEFVHGGGDGADDAVDLRAPGIGDDEDAPWGHAKESCLTSAQLTTSSRPSVCSTSAVQLSTQSPSLQ